MANIVTTDKFTGTIFIDTSSTNVSTQVNAVITQLEPVYLGKIFGRDNVEWIYDNQEVESLKTFYGFVVTILCQFMYCEVQKDLYSISTGVGSVILQGDAGNKIYDLSKVCKAWNFAVDEMAYMLEWMQDNKSLLPDNIECNEFDYMNEFGI